jgi:hypothetical protein
VADLNPLILDILLVAISAFSSVSRLGSQAGDTRMSRDKSLSATVSCYDASTGSLIGSRSSRTSILVSPDGGFRAYAESDAVATGPECRNTSKLFVAPQSSQDFRIVLAVEPSSQASGNGIDIIDWSPTGHHLLLAQGFWQYGSDVGRSSVRIYDADSDRLSSEGLVDEAFSQQVGKKCAARFEPLGFSRNGKAVVKAEPFFDYGEDKAAEDSCVRRESFWLVDFAIPAVRQLADRYKTRQFGNVAR